jgi:phosphoheptose isomerase
MNAKIFWKLLEDICQFGELIAGIETKGNEINIAGSVFEGKP